MTSTMFKLLPHRFKRIGFIIAPVGFLLWFAMQKGWISNISEFVGVTNATPLNISVAVLGFLFFMFGIYAMGFSKEKIEDEMIKNVRLESFRFAALIQLVLITGGLIIMGILKNLPGDASLMLFLIIAILIFWIAYIVHFNFIIHFRAYKYEK